MELRAAVCLLYCGYVVAQSHGVLYGGGNGGEVLPRHGIGGAKSGLVYIAVGWLWGVATEVECLNGKGIGSAKGRAYVLHTAHIVENNDEWMAGCGGCVLGCYAPQVVHCFALYQCSMCCW